MPDARLPITDMIIGKTLLGGESLFSEIRQKVLNAAFEQYKLSAMPNAMAQAVQNTLAKFQPSIVEHIADTELVSWVAGMDAVEKQFPEWLREEFRTGIRSGAQPPQEPPKNRFNLFDMFGNEPRLRFPIIETAAKRLSELNILSRDEWENVSNSAKNQAFFITGDVSNDTINDVRNFLVEDLESGTSLGGFKNRLGDALEASGIGPARVETIYRTNVQAAFRDGRETLASDPIVSNAFPYQAYVAIHDARVRSNHLKLESLGLNGTNVYRRDDPFWDYWTPPCGFNCRCGVRLMTIEAAARAGVTEARIWLESGRPPEAPEWRLHAIPFQPEPGFGMRGRVGSLAA